MAKKRWNPENFGYLLGQGVVYQGVFCDGFEQVLNKLPNDTLKDVIKAFNRYRAGFRKGITDSSNEYIQDFKKAYRS